MLAPSGTSLNDTGNGSLAVAGAGIVVDSAGKPALNVTGNGSITAPSVGVVGTVSNTGHGSIQNLTTGIKPVPNPLAGLPAPSLARPASLPSVKVTAGTQTISPGVYQDISVSGQGSLTMNPGTYVIVGSFSSSGNGRVSGAAVTLYLACGSYPTPCAPGTQGAGLSLTGNGSFALSGPTNGCLPLTIYADPNNTSTINITGNGTDTLTGIIYAASGATVLTGNGSTFNLGAHVIVGAARVTGNASIALSVSNLIACTLTLSPSSAGPNPVGNTQELDATLLTSGGAPVPNQTINFGVAGANPQNGSETTDSSGVAKFTYQGTNVGTDTAQASLTEGATSLQSNTSTITWVKATPQISTTVSAASITSGDSVADTATVSGGFKPGGSVSWNVYASTDTKCQTPLNGSPLTASLSSGSATSPSYKPNGPGTYQFVATYSGDQDNQSVSTSCGDTSEQVVVNSAVPKQMEPVTSTLVKGNFYAEDPAQTTFVAQPGDTPAFSQTFPNVQFNPPQGSIQYTPPSVDPTTRPFTDVTTNEAGLFTGTIPAKGNGVQAGVGSLTSFDAEFEANFIVSKAGDVTFNVVADDGFLLGVGGGATRVSGEYQNPPPSGTSPFQGYPLVGAYDQSGGSTPQTFQVTIHFPAPGSYPYELDYFECCGSDLSLTLGLASFTQQTSPLSIYVGYADGLRPAGSIFPFPWDGSPNVTFVGCPGCSYDSGALRFDNSSNSPIVLDSVTVDIGGNHFDIWPHSLTVAAGQILILAETGQYNLDTSDFSGTGCGQNNGVIPKVNVTIGGVTTAYNDNNQILNTFGYDLACQGNESQSWQRIGGGGTAINTPLPPAVTLAIAPTKATDTVGQEQKFTVSATDGTGNAVSGLAITLGVFGANTQTLPTATTDAAGNATFSYVGKNGGTDTVTATGFITGFRAASNAASVTWNIPVPGGGSSGGTAGVAPPAITSASPSDGTVVTKPVPVDATITPPAGETITSWSVAYQAQNGGAPQTIASGAGTPTSPLAMFDPTALPNDTYSLIISATASGGGTQTLRTTVAVLGNLKLGRYVTTYQDLSVPVQGFQMEVRRTYDSYDKRVGDFGVGWHVSVSDFRVSANRELGDGGWTEYTTGCFILCSWGYRTSAPHFVTVTWPDGHQEVFDFTPSGPQLTLIDFAQGTAAFTPRSGTDTTSKLEVADPTQQGFSYGFDGNLYDSTGAIYNPTQFRLTTHNGTVLVLDVNAGLVSETDTNGNSLTVDQTGIHSSSGQSITYTRDVQGRITQITGPSGQTLGYSYSPSGDLASSTDADGNTTTYSYDPNHDLSKATGPGGQPLQTLGYNSDGRLTSVTDGNGNTTTIDSSVSGQQQAITDPSGKLTTLLTYDGQGDLVRQDLVSGGQTLTTTYAYDANGRPTQVVDPLGRTTSATYDSAGDPTSLTDARGKTTHFTYNGLGEPTSITDATGAVVMSASYDAQGNLTSVQRPDGSSVSGTYNPAGELTQLVDGQGHTTTFQYDNQGDVTRAIDPLGHSTQATFDASGRVTSFTDAAGATTSMTYDPQGNLLGITDARGASRTYSYDGLGRVTTATTPTGTTTYAYDGAGHLTGLTAPNGTTTYTYDADGHVVKATSPAGDITTYSYDPLGRLTEAANAASDIRHTYDADGELLSESTQLLGTGAPPTTTVSYTYNANGQRLTRTGPDGTTAYSYDDLGRLTTLTDPSGGHFGLSYDSASRPIQMTRPNGVTDTLAYDVMGRLTRRTSSLSTTTIADAAYQYDAANRRISITDLSGTTTYGHDAVGRLTSSTPPGGTPTDYTYDSGGNRVSPASVASGTYSYDSADRLLGDSHTTYSYDSLGRLTKIADSASGATTALTWNGDGQLASVANPDGTSSAYKYDAFGRRSEVNEAGHTTRYIYDGDNIAYEYDGTGNLAASYVFAPGVDQPLEMTRGGQPSYYVQDGNSNVVALTDAAGARIATYRYDPFGVPTATTGTIANPLTFAGREYDPHNGLYFDRARYYDPAIGRFISPDPAGAINPYPYAASDPVDYTDPSGALFIEYAPLLPQQISMGTHLAGFVRCIGLAMLAGLNGADQSVTQDLLSNAANEFAGITDISGLVVGSRETRAQSATNLASTGIDVANESLTTTTFSNYAALVPVAGGTIHIPGAIVPSPVAAFDGNGAVLPPLTVRYTRYELRNLTTAQESEPFPILGRVSSAWGNFISPGLDLYQWYHDTCTLQCGNLAVNVR